MRLLPRICSAAAAVALIVACDDPKPQLPTGPSALAAVAVEVVGPATVAIGQSAQFAVSIRMADGTIKTATTSPDVQWANYVSEVLRLDASGVVTGLGSGTVAVVAWVNGPGGGLTGSKAVIVVPEGTYRLKGVITDADTPTQPVFGAQVSVTPGQAPAVTTNERGEYTIYGVSPAAIVRVERDGYDILERSLQLTDHRVQDFSLSASSRVSLTGAYSLEMHATGSCFDADGPLVRPDLQYARYDAVVTQIGPAVEVALTEPHFRLDAAGKGNRFRGQADGVGVTFTLGLPARGPDIVERLPDGTFRIPSGTFVTAGSAAGLSGTSVLSGISQLDATYPARFNVLASCQGPTRLALTPR